MLETKKWSELINFGRKNSTIYENKLQDTNNILGMNLKNHMWFERYDFWKFSYLSYGFIL